MASDRTFGFRTRALHAGTPPDRTTGARALPIHMTSSFVFESAEKAADLYALRTYGDIYTRISNPTIAAFEEKVASLEGGLGAIAAASGQAAQMVAFLTLAQNGDHFVAAADLYGGTITQLTVTLKRLGIETTFVPHGDPAGMRAAVLQQPGRPVTIEDLVLAEPQAGEVRVRILASGVCHSDLHLRDGEWPRPGPFVIGHEGSGIVEALGPGVDPRASGLAVGQIEQLRGGQPLLGQLQQCRDNAEHRIGMSQRTVGQADA